MAVSLFSGVVTASLSTLLLVGPWSAPGFAAECDESCTPCHGNAEEVHGDFNHIAAPGSGPVTIFDDSGHDDAGHVGAKPYFDIVVNCTLCHATDLTAIHGNDCATCHPTPYDTVGIWGGGCQQGGCHFSYHQNSTTAHSPFEDTSGNTVNDCGRCHQSWQVPQAACLGCHAAVAPGDGSPPVTTSNTLTEYAGAAMIDFSIVDNGKVGAGRTFYRLDSGTATAAGKRLLVTTPGQHQLEFWSMDQYANVETVHNHVAFTIIADTIPPTTTSDARPSYNQGAVITLTATDNSNLGVKTIYYRLDNGPDQSGTRIVIPPKNGVIDYTLDFWSEDWAGNKEDENHANFTVTSGGGTLRLVWGSSDVSGSPCPGDPEANAAWSIRKGSWSGPVVANGFAGCPNWSGVEDVAVPIDATPYFIRVDWWDSYWGADEQTSFANINVTAPGQLVRLGY